MKPLRKNSTQNKYLIYSGIKIKFIITPYSFK